jgi:hypothetical protein
MIEQATFIYRNARTSPEIAGQQPLGLTARESGDHVADLAVRRRAAWLVWVAPPARHQAPVPGQQRGRRDQSVQVQLSRQQPDQRGEDRSIRPRGPWPVNLPTQDRDFVPQHQQLGSDCGLAARQDRQPPEQAHHDQIGESETHDQRSCLIPIFLQAAGQPAYVGFLERYTPTLALDGSDDASTKPA